MMSATPPAARWPHLGRRRGWSSQEKMADRHPDVTANCHYSRDPRYMPLESRAKRRATTVSLPNIYGWRSGPCDKHPCADVPVLYGYRAERMLLSRVEE
jgi:hypothetical protein